MKQMIDMFLPLKQSKAVSRDQPWLTPSIKELIIKRLNAKIMGKVQMYINMAEQRPTVNWTSQI